MTAVSATPTSSDASAAPNRGRFVWHELMTSDVDAARAFYTKVIGWTTQKYEGGNVDYEMWVAGGRPVGGLMRVPSEAAEMGARPSWLSYVEVPDADATIAQATALGGTMLGDPLTIDRVGRVAVLRDPQGAVLAVITSATALPPETDPRPLEFTWHELVTTEQDVAIDYYKQMFGWESKGEFDLPDDKGPYKLFGRDRFTYGGVMRRPEGMPFPSHWLPHVTVADSVPAAIERAREAGGSSMLGPMDVPGGDEIAILTDPQGAAFAVHGKKAT